MNKQSLIPAICPICGHKLTWEGVHLICTGEQCIAKLTTSIAHFYSKSGIMLDGIAAKTIEKLLYNPECYMMLKDKPWALLDMTSYNIFNAVMKELGLQLTTNLQEAVTNISGKYNMAHFIAGLGFPGLAYKTSLRLCQYLKTGKLNIHVSEKAIASFMQAVEKWNDAKETMKLFIFANVPFDAKAIYCITGTLSKSREAMIEEMSAYGYEFSSGVTRETNYLIIGEDPGKVKCTKAKKYNIPIITEDQFKQIIKGG